MISAGEISIPLKDLLIQSGIADPSSLNSVHPYQYELTDIDITDDNVMAFTKKIEIATRGYYGFKVQIQFNKDDKRYYFTYHLEHEQSLLSLKQSCDTSTIIDLFSTDQTHFDLFMDVLNDWLADHHEEAGNNTYANDATKAVSNVASSVISSARTFLNSIK